VVEHFIQASQLSKAWVGKRAIRFGRGQYRLLDLRETSSPRLLMGIPRRLFREIPKEGFRMAVAWISSQEETFIRRFWNFNFLLGKAIEARNLAHVSIAQTQPSISKSND